jgi:AAA ATPase domain
MDPAMNPYAPGAGSPPPELAGRDELRETLRVALARIRNNLQAKSMIMIGLRGVGKTVLLDRMRQEAEAAGVHTVRLEAPEGRSLPALLAPQLRQALLRLSRVEAAKDIATRGLQALAGFVKGLKVTYNDIQVGLDHEPQAGLADNGDLEQDLQALLEVVGAAAKKASTAIVLFIDELQYVKEDQLAALISALHLCAQRKLPVCVVGAGLPQLRGIAGDAKSYAERLFDFPFIGALDDKAARDAIVKPAQENAVSFTPKALALVIKQTQGYPYFLQEWGKHSWDVADHSPITESDVRTASVEATAAMDASFFGVRFDRLAPAEKRYLRAMAELGPGPHRSGDIAAQLARKVTSLAPTRNNIIAKGMIWSPSHGDTAFTVPMFDEFMKRIMPGREWMAAQ